MFKCIFEGCFSVINFGLHSIKAGRGLISMGKCGSRLGLRPVEKLCFTLNNKKWRSSVIPCAYYNMPNLAQVIENVLALFASTVLNLLRICAKLASFGSKFTALMPDGSL